MNKIIKQALVFNDPKSMLYLSKFIAKWVRDELEDLHANNAMMNDKRMPEINSCIRNGVYKALFTLGNSPFSQECLRLAGMTERQIPDYWETPKLDENLEKELLRINSSEIKFNSTFLNEQLELGNIYRLPNSQFIRSKSIIELEEMPTEQRKKNLNKISSHLRKEGFTFDPCRDAYVKLSPSGPEKTLNKKMH